jgi:energy-coupling factor transporter ATP-binding protein EcfA2
MEPMQPLVDLNDVTFSYSRGTPPAIENISFKINTGEFVALIGPSGAGKSTLCYSLNGSIPQLFNGIMSGSVKVAGCDTFNDEIPALAEHVGLVVQNARTQLFNVTVLQEVAFGCENLGLPRAQIQERVSQALAFVGLSGYEEREPTALSGGQQQRLAMACVLAMDPELLVLDEPTSELDPIGAEQVMDVIARLNRELGKTILMVTHDMEFVTRYASRVLLLYDHHLIDDGTPQNIFSNTDLLEQTRIRPPQVCDLAHRLIQDGYPLERIPITLAAAITALKDLRHE